MEGSIRYINFRGYYDKFYECKERSKPIARHKGVLKYITNIGKLPNNKINNMTMIMREVLEVVYIPQEAQHGM